MYIVCVLCIYISHHCVYTHTGVAVQAGSSCGGGVTEDGRAIMRLSLPQEAPDFTLKVLINTR